MSKSASSLQSPASCMRYRPKKTLATNHHAQNCKNLPLRSSCIFAMTSRTFRVCASGSAHHVCRSVPNICLHATTRFCNVSPRVERCRKPCHRSNDDHVGHGSGNTRHEVFSPRLWSSRGNHTSWRSTQDPGASGKHPWCAIGRSSSASDRWFRITMG